MATREAIIEVRLEDKNAVARLGQLAAETRKVNDSIKLLNSIIDENGKATTNQARQLGELIARKKNLSGQSRELSNDLSGLTAAGMRFRDKMADATLEAIKQSGILGQLAARSDTLTREITELNASFKAGTITEAQYTEQQNKLQAELTQTTASMTRMDAKLDELNKDFQTGKITAEQFKAGVASVNAETQKAAGAFSKGVADLKNYALGMVGVVAAVQGLRAIYSNITGIIADFDKAQSRLAGILSTTKDGMSALTEQAKQLGATTAFTASQVSDAQTELAKLGFTQNEILSSTPSLLDLARGAGTDISQAAEVAAGTLNAFGLSAEETTRLADVMAKSFSSTALDIDKFTFGMRVVGPAAKNAGLSIEETTALLGVLADNNIRAETSGTGLRNILGKLAQTGMTFEDAMTQINTSTDKTKTAIDLFGLEASTVAIVLAENTAKTGELTAAFDKAGGSAKQLAEDMDDNLIGDKLKLTSAWEGFVISLDSGDGVFSRVSRNITTGLADILNYLTLINSTPDPFESIGYGKGSAVRAERATKAYREELEKLIQARAEEQGWKDKTLATSIGLRGVEDREIQAMRERTVVQLRRLKTLEDVEDAEKRVADALAKSGELLEKSGKISLKTAQLLILQRELQAKRTEIVKQGTTATEAQTAAEADAAEAARLQAEADAAAAAAAKGRSSAVRVLTDELRAFIAAQKAIESGQGIGRMDVVGGIGSQSEIGTPEDRLMPGAAMAADLDDNYAQVATLTTDYANLFMQLGTSVGASMGEAFTGVEETNKKILLSVIEMVRGAVRMYIAMAMAREVGTKGFIGLGTGVALTVAVEAILAAAISSLKQGFEEGGYTSRHVSDKKPVGVVHANEYVVPAPILRQPKYAALVDELERARMGYGLRSQPGSFEGGGNTNTYVLTKKQTGMVTNPRPSPGEMRAVENASMAANAPIFVRVEEINQVQGRVARIAERSTL